MRPLRSGSLLLGLAVLVASTTSVQAATPSLLVNPKRASIGHSVTLKGSHFPAKHYVTFLLAVPNAKHPLKNGEAFVQRVIKVAGNGTFKVQVKLPVLSHCGKATLYALQAQKISVGTQFTLTGCKLTGKQSPPPPPPSAPKKHKKKP